MIRFKVGQKMPLFALDATDGNRIALDPKAHRATVVVFTCNHCPYARAWHDRINAVARDYSEADIAFFQINPNDVDGDPEDSFERMQERVAAGDFSSPYLWDRDQVAAQSWGALATPDVFLLDREGTLVYRGAPDSTYDDESLRAQWLRDALDDVLAERAIRLSRTPVLGCSIKWRVEVLYWDGCPSYGDAVVTVQDTLRDLGREDVSVRLRRVATMAEAEASGFVGSPTVTVGLRDLISPPPGTPAALTCRVYRTRTGKPSPLPDSDDLRDALREAIARPRDVPTELQ